MHIEYKCNIHIQRSGWRIHFERWLLLVRSNMYARYVYEKVIIPLIRFANRRNCELWMQSGGAPLTIYHSVDYGQMLFAIYARACFTAHTHTHIIPGTATIPSQCDPPLAFCTRAEIVYRVYRKDYFSILLMTHIARIIMNIERKERKKIGIKSHF